MEIVVDLNLLTNGSFSFDDVRMLSEEEHKDAFVQIVEKFFSKISIKAMVIESECLIHEFGTPNHQEKTLFKTRYFYKDYTRNDSTTMKSIADAFYMSDAKEIIIWVEENRFKVCADPVYIGVENNRK